MTDLDLDSIRLRLREAQFSVLLPDPQPIIKDAFELIDALEVELRDAVINARAHFNAGYCYGVEEGASPEEEELNCAWELYQLRVSQLVGGDDA